MAEDGLEAVGPDEEVAPASRVREVEAKVREPERLLGVQAALQSFSGRTSAAISSFRRRASKRRENKRAYNEAGVRTSW